MCKEQRLRYASATEILEDLVTVYQDPSVSVSSLNAYDGEATAHTEKKMPRNAGRNHRNARNKKKNTHKNLLIAAISLFSVFILSIILVIYVFFGETGKEYAIPDFTGMTFEEAAIEAERNSNKDVTFTVSIAEEVFSDEEKGKIIDQNPDGGFKIKTKREIKLTVSRGPVLIKLADYTGKDCAEIQEMLEEKGLSVVIEQEDSNTYEEGKIIKHLPSKDTQMGEGDEITLFVSKGAENTYVPDVVGSTQQEAIVEIERNNLEVKVIEEDSSTVIKGEVIRQGKKANSVVPTGTVIEIYVSTGKPKADESQNSDKTTSSTTQKPKKASVSLTALSKTAPTKVKIMLDGKKVYEADVTTTSGNATVTFDVTAGVDIFHGADIYYNDTYIATKEVK